MQHLIQIHQSFNSQYCCFLIQVCGCGADGDEALTAVLYEVSPYDEYYGVVFPSLLPWMLPQPLLSKGIRPGRIGGSGSDEQRNIYGILFRSVGLIYIVICNAIDIHRLSCTYLAMFHNSRRVEKKSILRLLINYDVIAVKIRSIYYIRPFICKWYYLCRMPHFNSNNNKKTFLSKALSVFLDQVIYLTYLFMYLSVQCLFVNCSFKRSFLYS